MGSWGVLHGLGIRKDYGTIRLHFLHGLGIRKDFGTISVSLRLLFYTVAFSTRIRDKKGLRDYKVAFSTRIGDKKGFRDHKCKFKVAFSTRIRITGTISVSLRLLLTLKTENRSGY